MTRRSYRIPSQTNLPTICSMVRMKLPNLSSASAAVVARSITLANARGFLSFASARCFARDDPCLWAGLLGRKAASHRPNKTVRVRVVGIILLRVFRRSRLTAVAAVCGLWIDWAEVSLYQVRLRLRPARFFFQAGPEEQVGA